jgi:hypothetical protein
MWSVEEKSNLATLGGGNKDITKKKKREIVK